MQALQWNKVSGKLLPIQTSIPKCPPDGVLVKVAFSGVCGTDLHIMEKTMFSGDEVILGHEISGTVWAVGGDIKSFAVGDHVSAYPTGWSCTVCQNCLRGKPLFCSTGGLRGGIGFMRDGGWAEYCLLSPKLLQKVPAKMPLDVAVLCEPNLTIVRGLNALGNVRDGSKILVIGAGIIGLLMACVLHHRGYRDVMITEILESRMKIAQGLELGYRVMKPEKLSGFFDGLDAEDEGFEVIIDCSGSTKAIEESFPFMRRGGTLCMLGICRNDSKIALSPADIVLKEITIIGRVNDPYMFHQSVSLISNMYPRYTDLSRLGIRTYEFSDYQSAFEDLKAGFISKAIFKMP